MAEEFDRPYKEAVERFIEELRKNFERQKMLQNSSQDSSKSPRDLDLHKRQSLVM